MGMGGFDLGKMKKLQQSLNKLNEDEINAFCEECAKELAARLLRKVIKRTPVGQYPKGSGKIGGTLRRGWRDAMNHIMVNHFGDTYVIEIVNPTEYASYVEYGHRTANHKGWVKGQFCMTISEQEMQKIAPKLLESRIKKFLGGAFK